MHLQKLIEVNTAVIFLLKDSLFTLLPSKLQTKCITSELTELTLIILSRPALSGCLFRSGVSFDRIRSF